MKELNDESEKGASSEQKVLNEIKARAMSI